MTNQELIAKAKEAMTKAYAPYSHFQVGAALLAKDGRVFTGCNVENATYGATICAERTAVTKAVSEGVREFEKIAIVASSGDYAAPCGICRQVLFEFMPEGKVVLWSEGICPDGTAAFWFPRGGYQVSRRKRGILMEVKDFKVSISPREAAEVLEKHMDEDVLGEILDAYELQTEQGEVVMRLFEKYYMRSSNRATLTFLASNLDGVTHVHLAAGGGGQGMIFRFDWGAGEDFVELAEDALRQYMLE